MFIEVCDASVVYVEEHLDEAGGEFLPNYLWCRWGSRILKELTDESIETSLPTSAPTTPTSSATIYHQFNLMAKTATVLAIFILAIIGLN